ncbi:MAG: glycosyltransferase [Chthoniobacter sp.]|uniref:glycosyltransferase n=1 Tax=Chthoniobacter sp. TaxID=2510640 RepID=UPI0032A49710
MKLVILAPHCELPARDGAAIRSYEIARGLAAGMEETHFLAKRTTMNLPAGDVQPFPGGERSSVLAALGSAVTATHYLVLKHMPGAWQQAVAQRVGALQPDLIVVNFLWAWPLVAEIAGDARVFIDTHNFDPEWWNNLARHSRNPLKKLVCRHSLQAILRTLRELPAGTGLIHVSERDAAAYRELRPDLEHLVLPNGCTLRPRQKRPDYRAQKKRLYFLGLLSVQISFDALEFFAREFWPQLQEAAEFFVLGAHPSAGVRQLCAQHGWQLRENLAEEELAGLIEEMHFAVLPFAYGAGSKLKLVDACGRGVPVLATESGVKGFTGLPGTVLVSGSPEEWRQRLEEFSTFDDGAVEETLDFAARYSWEKLTADFLAQHPFGELNLARVT